MSLESRSATRILKQRPGAFWRTDQDASVAALAKNVERKSVQRLQERRIVLRGKFKEFPLAELFRRILESHCRFDGRAELSEGGSQAVHLLFRIGGHMSTAPGSQRQHEECNDRPDPMDSHGYPQKTS